MRIAALVALFGAAGSVVRYLLSSAVQRRVGLAFPAGTFVVNALGSLAMGFVMGAFAARDAEASSMRIALTAGFMGGFTTYSAFAYETWVLVERRAFFAATMNVAATWTVCLAGCAAGMWLGRAAASR